MFEVPNKNVYRVEYLTLQLDMCHIFMFTFYLNILMQLL